MDVDWVEVEGWRVWVDGLFGLKVCVGWRGGCEVEGGVLVVGSCGADLDRVGIRSTLLSGYLGKFGHLPRYF